MTRGAELASFYRFPRGGNLGQPTAYLIGGKSRASGRPGASGSPGASGASGRPGGVRGAKGVRGRPGVQGRPGTSGHPGVFILRNEFQNRQVMKLPFDFLVLTLRRICTSYILAASAPSNECQYVNINVNQTYSCDIYRH